MRYLKIFFLHLQQVFEQRSYMLVYFFTSLINPFLMILFWNGATAGGRSIIPGWNFSAIASYYFYLTLISGLLMAHIEDPVSKHHIKEGDLVIYLLKPLPYLLQTFFMEFSWRIVRIGFGIIIFMLFYFLWRSTILPLSSNLLVWLLILMILFLGFLISFIMKMIMGISAFWLIDTNGFYELIEVILFIMAGYLLPLAFLPVILSKIAYILPFSYIIYFPVLAIEGKLPIDGLVHVIGWQLFWIGLLYGFYRFLWNQGIKKFTAVGQ